VAAEKAGLEMKSVAGITSDKNQKLKAKKHCYEI
jgi:hypothetical protein